MFGLTERSDISFGPAPDSAPMWIFVASTIPAFAIYPNWRLVAPRLSTGCPV